MELKRLTSLLVPLALSLLLSVPPLRADSDGCFCASQGYLAFELRSFRTPGLNADHVLKVIRFDAARGIYQAGEAPMQDFQVHEMTCEQDRVEIAGWDRGYVKYIIDISKPDRLCVVEHVQDAERRFDPSKRGPAPGQLGLSRPGVFPLESADPEHKYQLVLTHSKKPVKDGLEHYRKAEAVRIDPYGNVSQRVLLYEDRSTEYPD
jgi:hypothetical protein